MKIQITSYINNLSDKDRLDLTIEIINNTKADLLLFSGHTIGFVNDIEILSSKINNTKSEVIFELKDVNSKFISNCLYHIKNNEIRSLNTNQIFSESIEIEGNHELADRLLFEFENRRKIKIKKLSILIIQCGEINILRNIQSKDNKVLFRFANNQKLNDRFDKLLSKVDIILNPIHSPMGNQGKMHKRRLFLSKEGKYYFSTSNTKNNSDNLSLKSLQYAYKNGKELIEIEKFETENSISRIYEI